MRTAGNNNDLENSVYSNYLRFSLDSLYELECDESGIVILIDHRKFNDSKVLITGITASWVHGLLQH